MENLLNNITQQPSKFEVYLSIVLILNIPSESQEKGCVKLYHTHRDVLKFTTSLF